VFGFVQPRRNTPGIASTSAQSSNEEQAARLFSGNGVFPILNHSFRWHSSRRQTKLATGAIFHAEKNG